MAIDRTAFRMGSYKTADAFAAGKMLSAEERLEWNYRMVRAILGDARFDKTAFSTRKF